ncbi:MAG: haloacid dehalogenase-like hydrolase [Patescibacteria group bacterium]
MYTLEDRATFDDVSRALTSGRHDLILTHDSRAEVMRRLGQVIHGAYDFDGTLNHRSHWAHLVEHLPEPLREEDVADLAWYTSISHDEQEQTPSIEHPDWFHGVIDFRNRGVVEGAYVSRAIARLVRGEITEDHVRTSGQRIQLRTGVTELFGLMHRSVVISLGMEDVIRACLDHHGLTAAAVVATRLRFDADRRLSGYEPTSVVVGSTKDIAVERFQRCVKADLNHLLIVGDSIGDIGMMRSGAFNVLMVPHSETQAIQAAYRLKHLRTMWGKVCAIVISQSILPLTELIQDARRAA